MKGFSILFTISLFIFAGVLAHFLRQSGVLPRQISEKERNSAVPVKFVNYHSNNPHHLN